MAKIKVLDKSIGIYSYNEEDFVCLTDIANYKDPQRSDTAVQRWLTYE